MSSLFGIGGGGNVGASGSFYPYSIDQSLRVPNTDSGTGNAYLNRTPASASNRKTWTYSAWVKRSKLGDGGANQSQLIWAAFDGGDADQFQFGDNNNLRFYLNDATNANIQTTAVYRDVSSWYHIVLAVDTTQATASDRVSIYVNGEEVTDFSTSTYPTQNYDTDWNNNVAHTIGQSARINSTQFFCGYLAEVNFIDGTALDATSFGETINGIWVPKEVSGLTYGTNGFYLSFADSAAIGDDLSGNTNDFTANNLAASDVVPDSPTNNFATLNPLSKGSGGITLSEGNLKAVTAVAGISNTYSTFGMNSGKWYWENYFVTAYQSYSGVSTSVTASGGNVAIYVVYVPSGNKDISGSASAYGASFTDGDIIGTALDLDGGTVTFYKNGVSQGSISLPSNTAEWMAYIADGSSSDSTTQILNFGQDSTFAGTTTAGGNADGNGYGDFKYAVPSGFLALNSANLPEPAIGPNSDTTSDEHFNTVLWTGNGSTGRSITGVNFSPDFVWTKGRSGTRQHLLFDTIRGNGAYLLTTSTNPEATDTNTLTTFDSDGFTIGSNVNINNNTETYVGWNWKAGGTAVSNTDGSITSQVSANPDAGFSIVSYTGTGASDTYGHGLGVAPNMILTRDRTNSAHWAVYVSDIGTGKYLELDRTIAVTTAAAIYPSVSSTTIGVGVQGGGSITNTLGDNYISYCFANVDGHLKCGSYVGNGQNSPNGTFVYTGFRPAFVMVKDITDTSNWIIIDNLRANPYNIDTAKLYANSNAAEAATNTNRYMELFSNGFRLHGNNAADVANKWNESGDSYTYLAFAEQPFKYANAR